MRLAPAAPPEASCEGRISLLKRRHGLNRCHRYRGFKGMQRWAGLGVIADTLINSLLAASFSYVDSSTGARDASNSGGESGNSPGPASST